MKKTKIVVIGAGSAAFGLSNLVVLMQTPELRGSTLCLVDINAKGLDLITRLAERVNMEWNCAFTIKSSTDRKDMLEDADFVLISVAIDREKCWKMDHEIAKKYGIFHYAENGGPGSLIHTARNITLIMPILRDIEKLCPDALVLNFTNPVPRICIAAARYTKVKMVGICHQLSFGYVIVGNVLAKELGLNIPSDYLFRWNDESLRDYRIIRHAAEKKLDILAAGINHFTWMLSIKEKENGTELYPLFAKRYKEDFSKFEPLTKEIFDIFKICPVPGDCHLVEYLPYTHNMSRNTWDKYDIQMYPLNTAEKSRENMWEEIEAMATGKKSIDHLRDAQSERAEQIIAGVLKDKHSYEPAVNIPNQGFIKNLPENSIIEIPAMVCASGVNGIEIGNLPEAAAELCRRQITVAELAVEASVKGDKNIALQSLLLDPMIDDPSVARALLDEYIENMKSYLPQFKA